MGADLDISVEVQFPNGIWDQLALFNMIYRGSHDETIHQAGTDGFPSEVDIATVDAASSSDTPYWVCWFNGDQFVKFADGYFNHVFAVNPRLLAIVEMVRFLYPLQSTRVICWYGQ